MFSLTSPLNHHICLVESISINENPRSAHMFPLFPQHRSLRRSLPVRKSVRISHGGDISQCHHWDVSFIVAVNLTISLRSSCCGSRGWSNSFLSWMRIHWGLMCAEKYILIRSLIPFYMALFPKSWGYPKSSSRHG